MGWGEFLKVRAELIAELRKEGKSCTEIAQTLSMDPGQVWLINAKNEPRELAPEDARLAITEHTRRVLKRFNK